MKRCLGCCVFVAAMGGCVSADRQPSMTCGGGMNGATTPSVPGMVGPWGQPVPMAAPYAMSPPNEQTARNMMMHSVPLDAVSMNANKSAIVQAQALAMSGGPPGVMQASGWASPAGVPGAPAIPNMPGTPGMMPSAGAMPGMPGMMPPAGAVAAAGALPGGVPSQFPTHRTSVRFRDPTGMKVSWYTSTPDGKGNYANSLTVPGRYNFIQAAIYRLKLSNIPNRPGLELYPTIEVVPSNAKTDTFLAHSAVPVGFTDEDLEQVAAGNYIVKVVYLPFPQFQDLATTGPDEVVSSRLEPGADPIAEACRRGNILLVVRLGNIDLEAPNTPPMNAPSAYQMRNAMPPMTAPGMGMPLGMGGGPGPMVPYGFMNQGKPLMMGPRGPMLPPGGMGSDTLPAPSNVPSTGSKPSSSSPYSVMPEGPTSKMSSRSSIQPAKAETLMTMPGSTTTMTIIDDSPSVPEKQSWWRRHWGSDSGSEGGR